MGRGKPITIETINKVKELVKDYMFIEIAKMLKIDVNSVSRIVKRNGFEIGENALEKRKINVSKGQFKKGQISHNKGKKMTAKAYEKIKKSMFKKGNVPANVKPIGYERICPYDKIIFIKVEKGKDMVSKSMYTW